MKYDKDIKGIMERLSAFPEMSKMLDSSTADDEQRSEPRFKMPYADAPKRSGEPWKSARIA